MMMPAGDAAALAVLVGIPEIARISGVGPSAVGNWRKRHHDFPKPKVQAPSGALFDLNEVETWLIENGKISKRVPDFVRLRALTDTARGLWQPDQVSRFSVACLVYLEACARAEGRAGAGPDQTPVVPPACAWRQVREVPGPRAFTRRLLAAAQELEELNPELSGLLVPAFEQVPTADGTIARNIALALDNATDDVTPRFALLEEAAPWYGEVRETPRGRLSREALADRTEADRFSTERSTPDDLAYLLVQLVDADGGVIFDPAAGESGVLLLAALWRFGDQAQLVGVERSEDVWRIARSRCYLYEVRADIRLGNALSMDLSALPKADCVVLDPPYGLRDWGNAGLYLSGRWRYGPPPPRSADYAWLQIALNQLKPDGRAAVVLPAGSLSRGGQEAEIRHAMIGAGVIEGVILLPPRLRLNTSIPLAVWLLRSPESGQRSDEILMVDASELATPSRSRFSLDEPVIDQLGEVAREWRKRRRIGSDDADIAVAVPTSSIVDAQLDPKRYREAPRVDIAALEDSVQQKRIQVAGSMQRTSAALARLAEHVDTR
jgi:type I restriction enzyme M protein